RRRRNGGGRSGSGNLRAGRMECGEGRYRNGAAQRRAVKPSNTIHDVAELHGPCSPATLFSRPSFHSVQPTGLNNQARNGAPDAIVNAVGEHIVLAGRVQVESAMVGPVPHDT